MTSIPTVDRTSSGSAVSRASTIVREELDEMADSAMVDRFHAFPLFENRVGYPMESKFLLALKQENKFSKFVDHAVSNLFLSLTKIEKKEPIRQLYSEAVSHFMVSSEVQQSGEEAIAQAFREGKEVIDDSNIHGIAIALEIILAYVYRKGEEKGFQRGDKPYTVHKLSEALKAYHAVKKEGADEEVIPAAPQRESSRGGAAARGRRSRRSVRYTLYHASIHGAEEEDEK